MTEVWLSAPQIVHVGWSGRTPVKIDESAMTSGVADSESGEPDRAAEAGTGGTGTGGLGACVKDGCPAAADCGLPPRGGDLDCSFNFPLRCFCDACWKRGIELRGAVREEASIASERGDGKNKAQRHKRLVPSVLTRTMTDHDHDCDMYVSIRFHACC